MHKAQGSRHKAHGCWQQLAKSVAPTAAIGNQDLTVRACCQLPNRKIEKGRERE